MTRPLPHAELEATAVTPRTRGISVACGEHRRAPFAPGAQEERERLRVRGIEALLDAGAAARQRFQTEQAIRYANRALGLMPTGQERLRAVALKARSFHEAVDLLPFLDPVQAGPIAEATATRMENMGAFASAVEARLVAVR